MPYRPDAALPGALVLEDKVKPPHVILMGGPGCGKDVIVRSLCEKYGIVHISVGAILREKVRQKTESSELIAEYMVEGRLVPDELALSIVREKISSPEVQERGWMLDNFPRTADQAEAMMQLGIIPEKFIFFRMPEDKLSERCLGRRVDPETGNTYYSDKLEPSELAPEVQQRLVRRDDDHEDAVARRLELFLEGSDDVLEIFDTIKLDLDGRGDMTRLLKEAHLYVKPPAPLYAGVSARPANVSAEALKEAFTRRAEESMKRAPAEGEEAAAEEAADDNEAAGRPPLLGDDFRRQLALDMLDICLGERFDEEEERARARRLTYQFAAQHAIGTLDTLVNVLFLQHDGGDEASDASWAAGEEPAPADVDNWGRGVVPLKRRLKPLTLEEVHAQPIGSRPASSSSRSSRMSRGTGGMPGAGKKKEEKKGRKEEKRKEDKKVAEEPSAEDKLRALLKSKQEEALAKTRKQKDYDEAVARMDKQIKSLASRGQNFTMDANGEVLLVNELAGDKIPGPNVNVKSNIGPLPRAPADPTFNAKAGDGAAAIGKFFTPSDTVQPPAVESHVLATGVVLKEGGQMREGPPRPKDTLHMTRKEYTAIIEAEDPTIGSSLRLQDGEEEEEEEEEEGYGGDEGYGDGGFGGVGGGVLGASGAGGGVPGTAGGEGPTAGGIPGLGGGLPPGATYIVPTAKVEAEVKEVVAYDWEKTEFYEKEKALVPADQRSVKPDDKLFQKSVGLRIKKPRDRFIHPQAVVASNYLPPPIFPGTHGHGVVTSYLADQNEYIREESVLKLRGHRTVDTSTMLSQGHLSPLKGKAGREPSFVEGDSVEVDRSLDDSIAGARRQIVIDYPKHFPKGKPSTITTADKKLMREATHH